MTPVGLNLTELTLPESLGSMLRSTVTVLTWSLLERAFAHGGYVAGGFGTSTARHVLGIDDDAWWVRRHLGQPRALATNCDTFPFHRSKKLASSDIDVWFATQEELDGFLVDIEAMIGVRDVTVTRGILPSGRAREYVIENDARIQVITSFIAPMAEQVSRFDIYNGAVALTNDRMLLPDAFEQLERENCIHVMDWSSPWVFNRVRKWLWKKRYGKCTPETATRLVDLVVTAMAERHDTTKPWVRNLQNDWAHSKPSELQQLLSPLIGSVPGEALLRLSSMCPMGEGYDLAVKELVKRHEDAYAASFAGAVGDLDGLK